MKFSSFVIIFSNFEKYYDWRKQPRKGGVDPVEKGGQRAATTKRAEAGVKAEGCATIEAICEQRKDHQHYYLTESKRQDDNGIVF